MLSITRKFLVDSASSADSDSVEALTPAKISKKDSLRMNNISLYRVKLTDDYDAKVILINSMSC